MALSCPFPFSWDEVLFQLLDHRIGEVVLITCAKCGQLIKRDIKRVKTLQGNLVSYHRACLEKQVKRRVKDAHVRSHKQISKVDRPDEEELVRDPKLYGFLGNPYLGRKRRRWSEGDPH